MSTTEKKYRKYKSQPRKISTEEEHALIKAAQEGDKKAAETLLKLYDFFIVSVARKVAYQTGASKNLEDLIQEGRMALYEKIFSYSFEHSTRLTSYAYREMTHRMYQEACDFLEIVPLTKKFELHQAHKELDRKGFTPENVKNIAKKYSLSENVINSLHRSTVPIDGYVNSFIDYRTPESEVIEKQFRASEMSGAWLDLNSVQRMVLAMLYISNSIRLRTKVFGIKPKELKLIEACAKKALYQKVKNE